MTRRAGPWVTLGVAAALPVIGARTLRAQEKFKLVFRPPAGEALRYHDHFEMWVTVGSEQENRPTLVMDIWRTETANTHGDTVEFVAIVDSASALAPLGGAPPEFAEQARLMRGSREITRITDKGRELSHEVRGITVGDVFSMLMGGRQDAEREYRQWRTMPDDSVAQGQGWDDSVSVKEDSVEWRGRVTYRLRRVQQHNGVAVGRIDVAGTLHPSARDLEPERITDAVDLDVETGRLIRADSHQYDGYVEDRVSVVFRSSWQTDRVP